MKEIENRDKNVKEVCKEEKGVVLVIAIALLAVLGLVGAVVVNSTTVDISISNNYKSSKQAFFAAESGTEEARARLKSSLTPTEFIGDTSNPADELWSAYIKTSPSWDAAVDDPNYDVAYTNTGTGTLQSAPAAISYWVKVRHKKESDAVAGSYIDDDSSDDNIIYYGYLDPGDPTVLVQFATSSANIYHPVEIVKAYGDYSNSLKNVEIEVVRVPGPPILSAIYTKTSATVNGSSVDIDGNDACGQGPALDTIYTLQPGVTTSSGGPVYTPSDPVNGPADIDIDFYVEELRSSATTITNRFANDITDWGSISSFISLYADSNTFNPPELKINNETGYGLLLVEGDLELGGNFTWNGLVLVTGTVKFNGGGQPININGAVLANQTVTLNGNIDTNYDSCMIDDALSSQALSILQWKQIY